MPKVKSINIKHESKSGEAIEFKSDITVDGDGVFAVTFPEKYELDNAARIFPFVFIGFIALSIANRFGRVKNSR